MNSIPLVARKMGEVIAATKRKSVDIRSFSVAIKVRPEVIVTAKTISRPIFIRLIMVFMELNFKILNRFLDCELKAKSK